MKNIFKYILLLYYSMICLNKSYAYPLSNHQIGISPAKVTNILQLPINSQPLTYKYYISPSNNFRLGFDGIFESDEAGEQRFNIAVGYERCKMLDNIVYGLGLLIDFQHQSRSNVSRYYNRYGISPVASATLLLSKRISLSTEIKLDFLYHSYIDKTSFVQIGKSFDLFTISIGSIGLLLINFHI